MAIDKIGSSPVSFGNFYVNSKGAFNLASELVGKPVLEQKFMQNLVEPLLHTKMYSVVVDGDNVGIINNKGKKVMSIIQKGSIFDRTLGIVYDHETLCRNAVMRNSHIVPTNNFEKDGYLFHNIEIAKNIIFDREAMTANQATKAYTKFATETLDQKYDRFTNTFKYNG